MPIAGLDVHKRVIQAVVMQDDGAIVHRERFECTRDALVRFATEHLGPQCRVALEATTNTWSIVELLEPLVGQVVVSNPLRTKAIASAKVKTDKVDAEVLAHLLRCEYLPMVWQPDPYTRTMRRLTSRRTSLVSQRTAVKNRIHAVLHQRLIEAPKGDLFSNKNRAWLAAIPLDEQGRTFVDSELRLLVALESELDEIADTLAVTGFSDDRVRLLITLPGIDVAVAQTLLSTLGDFSRFRDGDHAAAYLGLVPSTRQSADHCYHGPITKRGRSHARWLMVQAAQHVARHPGPLGVFFRKLARKKNRNVAVVATARKMVVIAWHMLRNNEPYRYALPATTQGKLQRLRVAATGKQRKRGPAKGTPRSSNYGSGKRTRSTPSLPEIYDSEGVPPNRPLARGEERMLQQRGLADLPTRLGTPTRTQRSVPSDSKANSSPQPPDPSAS